MLLMLKGSDDRGPYSFDDRGHYMFMPPPKEALCLGRSSLKNYFEKDFEEICDYFGGYCWENIIIFGTHLLEVIL